LPLSLTIEQPVLVTPLAAVLLSPVTGGLAGPRHLNRSEIAPMPTVDRIAVQVDAGELRRLIAHEVEQALQRRDRLGTASSPSQDRKLGA